jgi:hypothetical protein
MVAVIGASVVALAAAPTIARLPIARERERVPGACRDILRRAGQRF